MASFVRILDDHSAHHPLSHSFSSFTSVHSDTTIAICRNRYAPDDDLPTRVLPFDCSADLKDGASSCSISSLPNLSTQYGFNANLKGSKESITPDNCPAAAQHNAYTGIRDWQPSVRSWSSSEEDTSSNGDFWHDPMESQDEIDHSILETASSKLGSNDVAQARVFHRWVSTLRRRNQHRDRGDSRLSATVDGRPLIEDTPESKGAHLRSGSYVSSFQYVTSTRTASMTMTTASLPSMNASILARSSHSVIRVPFAQRLLPNCHHLADSDQDEMTALLDEAALKRSHKRARKLLELTHTEEGYLSDLRSLHNAYFTILLPHVSTTPKVALAEACVSDLLQLHEEIFNEIQEYSRILRPCKSTTKARGPSSLSRACDRLDATHASVRCQRNLNTEFNMSHLDDQDDALEWTCTPEMIANVARIFTSKAKRLLVYEEYGLRCDAMHLFADLLKVANDSSDYDRALETLQASVCSTRARSKMAKKALGLKDLLIKPVQRITRYELLFKDLCKLTPSCDDPLSHAALDDAMFVISQACHNLNEARGSPERLMAFDNQRWLSQRLQFRESACVALSDFGRIILCGALYIVWRGTTSIKGLYVAAVLYKSCLIFATNKSAANFDVVLGIPLAHSVIEESDNGKALQCHTTPHTWKVVFENRGSSYEVMCVACSAAEAKSWRERIAARTAVETQHTYATDSTLVDIPSPLTEEMRSVGKVYGREPQFCSPRRANVQRAATLGPLTELNQVIIKNTQATMKDGGIANGSLSMPRSQSVMTPSHIPTLAPRRNDRIQLETILADVWSKDLLPFPGLGPKKGEYSMRASANHVMRKLSMASITSNFSKRSMSFAGINHATAGEWNLRSSRGLPPPRTTAKQSEKRVITFHTAPEAFLPEDFEIDTASRSRGRLAGLRTFTMGGDRGRVATAMEGEQGVSVGVKRSQSAVARHRRSDMLPECPITERSKTAMSTPALLSERESSTEVEAGRTIEEVKVGRRRRARSRLARLLG